MSRFVHFTNLGPEWDDGLIVSDLDEPRRGCYEGAPGTLVMERGKFRFNLVDLDIDSYFAYDVQLTGALTHWYWEMYHQLTQNTATKRHVCIGDGSRCFRMGVDILPPLD
jgi:hypothetical protein